MIKVVIFDLDGILVESKMAHYMSLNKALEELDPKYVISIDEHLSTYDGLPTTKKLKMLTKFKGLPESEHNNIWKLKQKHTITAINELFVESEKLKIIFSTLKAQGYKLCVASNSIREIIRLILHRLGILQYIDYYYSNEDVKSPKPDSEMYLRCILDCKVNPNETLILEDSHHGRLAAINSGAYLLGLRSPEEVTLERIQEKIELIENRKTIKPKWQGGKMKVLIPMAGRGQRFKDAGFTFPKPLIDIQNKTMIQVVVENLNIDAQHIFIVLKEHYDKYNLKTLLNLISPNCIIIQTDGVTEGAAVTCLLAKEYINDDEPLLMANSDQWVDWDSNVFMYTLMNDKIDGGILTFKGSHPKWSYAALGDNGFVTKVAEKEVISEHATTGHYYWTKGSDFVKYAEQMIQKNIRVNNEFYVAPVYNEAIQDGKKIKIFPVDQCASVGTPEDLEVFMRALDNKEISI